MKSTATKKRKLTITMDQVILKKLKAVSASRHRSVSQQICVFIEKQIDPELTAPPAGRNPGMEVLP